MTNDGILAIWHDVDAAIGDDYERWYFQEHLPERVGVPGFLAGRRYEAVEGAPRFLTYYEGKGPDTFVSKPYLDRLNDPTPWSTSVLRHFRDTNRTICRRTWEAGEIRGAWGVVRRVNRSGGRRTKRPGDRPPPSRSRAGDGPRTGGCCGSRSGAGRFSRFRGRRRRRTSGPRRTGSSKGRCSPTSPARRTPVRPRPPPVRRVARRPACTGSSASFEAAEGGGVAVHFSREELAARRARISRPRLLPPAALEAPPRARRYGPRNQSPRVRS